MLPQLTAASSRVSAPKSAVPGLPFMFGSHPRQGQGGDSFVGEGRSAYSERSRNSIVS
jgi:hypothetical protein